MAITITASEAASFKSGVNAMLNDRARAFVRFVEVIAFFNPAVDAEKVASFYIAKKMAKYNGAAQGYTVKHGAFLEADVLARAQEMANAA